MYTTKNSVDLDNGENFSSLATSAAATLAISSVNTTIDPHLMASKKKGRRLTSQKRKMMNEALKSGCVTQTHADKYQKVSIQSIGGGALSNSMIGCATTIAREASNGS